MVVHIINDNCENSENNKINLDHVIDTSIL